MRYDLQSSHDLLFRFMRGLACYLHSHAAAAAAVFIFIFL